MDQIHKRFTTEQIKFLFQGYCQGTILRTCIEETLGIGKTRFFALLKDYRQSSKTFSLLPTSDAGQVIHGCRNRDRKRTDSRERVGGGQTIAYLWL